MSEGQTVRRSDEQTAIRGIAETVKTLPVPENDFAGVQVEDCAVPNNILLFHRDEELSGGYGALHHRYVLHCALETGGTVIVDGSHIRVDPGEAVLVFPHQFHHYADFDARRISWLFITFELQSDAALEVCRYRRARLSDEAIWIVERLLAVYRGGTQTTDAEGTRLLTGLLLRELRRSAVHADDPSGSGLSAEQATTPLMKTVAAYVHSNLHRLFTIAEIADHVSYSKSRLRNVFHDKMSMSLGAYIRRARINRAEALLVTSGLTVTRIAEQCGYESIYSFSRAFKKETGMSPRAWRNRHGTPRMDGEVGRSAT